MNTQKSKKKFSYTLFLSLFYVRLSYELLKIQYNTNTGVVYWFLVPRLNVTSCNIVHAAVGKTEHCSYSDAAVETVNVSLRPNYN